MMVLIPRSLETWSLYWVTSAMIVPFFRDVINNCNLLAKRRRLNQRITFLQLRYREAANELRMKRTLTRMENWTPFKKRFYWSKFYWKKRKKKTLLNLGKIKCKWICFGENAGASRDKPWINQLSRKMLPGIGRFTGRRGDGTVFAYNSKRKL